MPEIKPLNAEEIDALERSSSNLEPSLSRRLIATVRDRERQRDEHRNAALQNAKETIVMRAERDELQRQLDATAAILGDALGGAAGTCSEFATAVVRQLDEARKAIQTFLKHWKTVGPVIHIAFVDDIAELRRIAGGLGIHQVREGECQHGQPLEHRCFECEDNDKA